ncbi:MAG: periplasmic heavy metal sensor [Bauldia sp.]|nr:periplasmic heavy metal sensor [Bauldia sp.]
MTIRGLAAAILLILLFVSLGLNFLGVGFIAARASGGGQAADLARIVEIGLQTFPPEIRRSIGRDLVENRVELRQALEDYRAAQARLYGIMQESPLDEAALRTAFAEVREKTAALQALGQDVLARAVVAAPPDARAQIRPPRPLGFVP